LTGLLRPLHRGIAAMVGLSVGGVLVGLVPPLALGVLVDALIENNDKAEAAVMTGVIVLAITIEATAYVLSDGMYARNASSLYRNLRMHMFDGAARRPSTLEGTSGLASRFISDAETLEQVTMSLIDSGTMLLVEFGSALVAVALLQGWAVVAILPALTCIWIVTRRMQEPAALAGQRRQEELEAMTNSISRELDQRDDPEAASRFRVAAERLMGAEIRLGWLRAVNLQGSGGLAKLGPITVVVVSAFVGTKYVGTLLSLYLLAQRVFWSFDGIVDLSLGMHSVRGAVARCFDLIDTPGDPTEPVPLLRHPVGGTRPS
jgi:ABC-type multidrug transport system fused ATPase/permease subunit